MQEFQPKVGHPKIRAAERNHRLVTLESDPLPRRGFCFARAVMQVTIRLALGMDNHQLFRGKLAVGFRFVNGLPALLSVHVPVADRNPHAPAVRIADLKRAFDLQVLPGSRQSELRRQRLAFGVGTLPRLGGGLDKRTTQQRECRNNQAHDPGRPGTFVARARIIAARFSPSPGAEGQGEGRRFGSSPVREFHKTMRLVRSSETLPQGHLGRKASGKSIMHFKTFLNMRWPGPTQCAPCGRSLVSTPPDHSEPVNHSHILWNLSIGS